MEAFLKDVVEEHLEKPTFLKEGCKDPRLGRSCSTNRMECLEDIPVMKDEGDLVAVQRTL